MRIDGHWLTGHDGASRPVVDAYVVGLNDALFYERFLVDIGADRTVSRRNAEVVLLAPNHRYVVVPG